MNENAEIENFDTSVIADDEANPIFGEDNEIIGWETMNESVDWELDERYQDPAESDWEANTRKRCADCVDSDIQCVGCWSYDMGKIYPGYAWND